MEQESTNGAGAHPSGAGEYISLRAVGQESTSGAAEHVLVGQESQLFIYNYTLYFDKAHCLGRI